MHSGMLVVTIPDFEADTKLDFSYWISDDYVYLGAQFVTISLLSILGTMGASFI
jgi:hypothetical protein